MRALSLILLIVAFLSCASEGIKIKTAAPTRQDTLALDASIRQKIARMSPEERMNWGVGTAADSNKVFSDYEMARRRIEAGHGSKIDSIKVGLISDEYKIKIEQVKPDSVK